MSMHAFPTVAPIGTEPRPWSFPVGVRTVLPGGLTIAAVRVPTLPIVQVRWVFASGRAHESVERVGSARLLQTIMRHGTESFDSATLADTLDRLGARLHLGIAVDSSVVSLSALSGHKERILDLVDEITFRPTLPEAVLERERAQALEIHRHERAQADAVSGLWLASGMYGPHPYGRPSTTSDGLRQTSVEDLRNLHGSIVDPGLGLVLVVGDIDPEEMVQRLAARYRDLPAGTGRVVHQPKDPTPIKRQIRLIERPGAEQSVVGLGLLAVSRSHDDYLPLRVANQVFGGGASSRLFTELRERRSLTYGAYSALDCGLFAGDISASLSCAPNKTGEAVSALSDELQRMADGTIDSDNLTHAKQYLVGAFPQRASGVAGVASLVSAAWIHELPATTWSNYQASISAVESDAVERVSQRWFSPDSSIWVVVGTEEALASANEIVEPWGVPIHRHTIDDVGFEDVLKS